MMKAPRFFRLNNNYLNLRILKVKHLYDLEIPKLVHTHFNNALQECFYFIFYNSSSDRTHFTRASTNFDYDIAYFITVRGQRSIRSYGPKVWNEIPVSTKTASKLCFKNSIKLLLLHY